MLKSGLLIVGAEFIELTSNYEAKNPLATAFLLRNILEELLYLAFEKKTDFWQKIQVASKGRTRLVRLEEMIDAARKTDVNHSKILLEQTAHNVLGAKFLGDTAPHNPVASVHMQTIDLAAIPLVHTAYDELVAKIPVK